MVSVYIKGQFLDIDTSTKVTIRRRHNLYDGTDPTIKRGSYTLPFTIALTDRNKELLGDPHIKDNRNQLLIDEPVWLYLSDNLNYGLPYLSGKLYISRCTDTAAECSVVTSGLGDFGDATFDDIEMGAPSIYNDPTTIPQSVAKDTLVNPNNYDYAFIPVWNPSFTDATDPPVDSAIRNFQNPFNTATGQFYTLSGYKNVEIITPFVKIHAVLKKIFDHIGISLINDLEDNPLYPELKNIYLHHVNNLQSQGKWPLEFQYNECMPDMKISEFFKQYASMFFLGVFPDPVSNKVHLKLWKDVLRAPIKYNWTNKLRQPYSINGAIAKPMYIEYEVDSSDEFITPLPTDPDNYVEVINPFLLDTPKMYSVMDSSYHRLILNAGPSAFVPRQIYRGFRKVEIGGLGDPIEIKMSPLLSNLTDDINNPTALLAVPYIGKLGSYRKYRYDGNTPVNKQGGATVEFSELHDFTEHTGRSNNARLILYRGMKNLGGPFESPYSSSNAYDPDTGTESYTQSLHLDRDKGLVNTLGAEVLHFISNHKKINYLIDIDLNDFMNIKEYDKVRVDNLDYLVSEMEITIGATGIEGPAKVVLATV